MSKIIKNGAVLTDEWLVLRLQADETPETIALPNGKIIIPWPVWCAQKKLHQERSDIAIWLASNEQPDILGDEIYHFALIAIDFPHFSDGRGYSMAYNLRNKLGYRGELRAIGDVLRDQIFYMRRVGFDAFSVRADKDIHDALKGLSDFSETYQTSSDQTLPLFRRAKRAQAQI